MSEALEQMMGPGTQAPVPGASPEAINLRAATNPQQSCATCGNGLPDQSGKIMCQVLQQLVEPTTVSDAYQPAAAPGGDIFAQLFGGAA